SLEIQRISRSGMMTTSMTTNGVMRDIPERKKLIVFRIIQESLQNIIKHSRATAIEVNFAFEADMLRIKVEDNGKGFKPELLDNKGGLGLQNIRGRAALIGGQALVDSRPDQGTIIEITLPYD